MDRLKTFAKYALWIVGLYFFTAILIFIGFNLNYKKIDLKYDLPEQITIAKAEATSKQGRIYGYVQNNEQNNLNGKFIKAEIYDENNNIDDVQYLKIEDLKLNEKKMFKIFFATHNAKKYAIFLANTNN